jgi:hypothetical protein
MLRDLFNDVIAVSGDLEYLLEKMFIHDNMESTLSENINPNLSFLLDDDADASGGIGSLNLLLAFIK